MFNWGNRTLFWSVRRSSRAPCVAFTMRGSGSHTWSSGPFPHSLPFPGWSSFCGAQTSPTLWCARRRAGTQVDTELATGHVFHSLRKHVPSDFPPWPLGVAAEEKPCPAEPGRQVLKVFKSFEKVELFNELFYNFKSHLSFSLCFFPPWKQEFELSGLE